MDTDADVSGLNERVLHRQLRLLAEHLPVVLPASLLAAGLVGWGFWDHVDQPILIYWLCGLFVLSAGRVLLSWYLVDQPLNRKGIRRMKGMLLSGALLSGAVWGIGGILFFDPGNPYGFALLVIILGGLLSGALGSHSYYFPTFFAFAVPEFLPLIWEFSREEGEMYEIITLVMLLFLLLNLYYSKKHENVITTAIRLQFANDSLLEELRSANRELHQYSYTDPLTGIGNRRQFDLDMEQTLQVTKTTGEAVCLILMDVDYFKAYNDRFGHPKGDAVLKDIARVMLKVCQEQQVRGRPMRIGGEEFSLLLKGDLKTAAHVAETMRQEVSRLYSGKGQQISASFGVAMTNPQAGGTRKKLFKSADQALYEAKTAGRNQVVVFDGQDSANQS